MEHTPTPWYCDGDGVYSNVDCEGAPLAYVLSMGYDNDFRSIDARRIVACVNACTGLDTSQLEQFGLGTAFGTVLFDVTAERDQLMLQNAQLLAALRDVISWVPGREKWHTDEPIKAVERARAVMGATVKESLTVDHQASSGASVEQQLATERASLFAESQRKQQLEEQVAELLGALESVTLTQDDIDMGRTAGDEQHAEARAVIQKVRGGK